MRWLSLFWVVLLILPLVVAQEPIDLERNPISIYLIIPAIVIVLILFVLIGATFRQNITRSIVRMMSFRRLFSKVQVREHHEHIASPAAQGITKDAVLGYMSKISNIEKGMSHAAPEEVFRDFSVVAKDFFANLVGANHAYTDEEIAANLEKKRKALVDFSEKISKMKYSGYQPNREEVVQLINEFKEVVSSQVRREKGAVAATKSSQNLIARIIEEDKNIFNSIKQYVDFLKTEDKKQQIKDLLSEEEKVLRSNIGKAKKVYDSILKLYVQLSPEEKKLLYPKLLNFYDSVNKMVFSSLYGKKTKEELAYFSKELAKLKEMPEQKSLLHKLTEIPVRLPKVKPPEPPKVQPKKAPMVEAGKDSSGVFEIRLRIPTFGLHKPHIPRVHMPEFGAPKVKLPELRMPQRPEPMPAERPVAKPMPVEERPVEIELPELKLPKLPKPAKEVKRPVELERPEPMPLVVEAESPEMPSAPVITVSPGRRKMMEQMLGIEAPPPPLPPITVREEFARKQSVAPLRPFMHRKMQQEELHELEGIKTLIKEEPRRLPKQRMTPEEKMIVGRINRLMESMPVSIEAVDHVRSIRGDIRKAGKQLSDGMLSEAEVTYERIKPRFMRLSEGEKKVIYPDIIEFYKRLRVATDMMKVHIEVKAKVKADASLAEEEQKLLEMLENLKSSIS